MTVAVFVNNESDAASLIPWGIQLAASSASEVLVVCARKSKGKRGWENIESADTSDNVLQRSLQEILAEQSQGQFVLKQNVTNDTPAEAVVIEMRELIAPQPEEALVEEIQKLNVQLILLCQSQYEQSGKDGGGKGWVQQIVEDAPCQVAVIRGSKAVSSGPQKILVAAQGVVTTDEELALERACRLAERHPDSKVTLVYVRPDDDIVAAGVARRHLAELKTGWPNQSVPLKTTFSLADNFATGIAKLELKDYDLLLVGTRNAKTIRSIFRNVGISDDGPVVPVMTIRTGVPLADQMWSKFKRAVRSKVPQMGREHRVHLVDRLQSNSRFDFDFIALISLSTLIAALGLARDSGAVVIGAMLVAPLMTPLVAMGFALVQGNIRLMKDAFKSVILGFTVALMIGGVLGLLLRISVSDYAISQEMLARGTPNFLDLVVALASGVAGAYAMGRPNLISALPGVAIAAALVPPIATSGLALTMGNPSLSAGASMLFFTNLVAIVLGTAITFWGVGISTRPVSEGKTTPLWPRVCFLGFVFLSFALAIWMSIANPLDHGVEQDKPVQATVQKQVD